MGAGAHGVGRRGQQHGRESDQGCEREWECEHVCKCESGCAFGCGNERESVSVRVIAPLSLTASPSASTFSVQT